MDDFTLRLADQWIVCPPDPVERAASLPALVDERISADPGLTRHRKQLLSKLEAIARFAETNQAALAAVSFISAQKTLAEAVLLVGYAGRLRPESPSAEVEERLQAIAREQAPRRRLFSRAAPANIQAVELPAGPAALARFNTVFPAAVEVQYFLPHPEKPELLFLRASTPSLPLGDSLASALAEIAASVRYPA